MCAYQDLKTYDDKGVGVTFHSFETDKGSIADIEIAKHSKNIIDLIEVGDYVNGEKIDFTTNQKHLIIRDNINLFDKYKNIKSIVTHKQFESVEYKI